MLKGRCCVSDAEKSRAIRQFFTRKDYSAMMKRIDEMGNHAGSPLYCYCKFCGTPTEVLTREPCFEPSESCSQCKELLIRDWMDEAKKSYGEENV